MDTSDKVVAVIVVVFVWSCGFCIGIGYGTGATRHEAISAGVGRWTIDAETGERQFVFGQQKGEFQ